MPNFNNARMVYIDTETRDPNLLDKGPGFLRGESEVVGFSVYALNNDGDPEGLYVPIRHANGNNYHNPIGAIEWLKDICKTDSTKVFHNAMYDVEALDSLNIEVNGNWICTMVNECIIDENILSFSLDSTAERRVGASKDEWLLNEATAAFGLQDPKGELWKLPPEYVGPYAEQDARLLAGILRAQQDLIRKNDLMEVYKLESRLLKVVWAMRKQGVRINVEQALILKNQWNSQLDQVLDSLPQGIDIWSADTLAEYCHAKDFEYNLTDSANPSFTHEWLESHADANLRLVARGRRLEKMVRDFIEGMVLGNLVNDRIHAQFHTTRRDEGGTRTGRFSSSHPNLQQVPARDIEFGPAIRALFIPDQGAQWGKFDYSSQEPRITVNFAAINNCTGVRDVVEQYKRNKAFDFHSIAVDLVGIDRTPAKTIGLGITYGMEIYKLARSLGVDVSEAKVKHAAYKSAIPFIPEVFEIFKNHMERYGYVCTALGRRAHIDDLKFAYKALNRAVQGTGADMMKQAMVDVYEELDIAPLLTVHDESDYNIYDDETTWQIVDLMENALDLQVPAFVEPELGPSWGELKKCL